MATLATLAISGHQTLIWPCAGSGHAKWPPCTLTKCVHVVATPLRGPSPRSFHAFGHGTEKYKKTRFLTPCPILEHVQIVDSLLHVELFGVYHTSRGHARSGAGVCGVGTVWRGERDSFFWRDRAGGV